MKERETGAFPDVWLTESTTGERVGVEVTHFDTLAISQLEGTGQYTLDVTLGDLALAVHQAIVRKNDKLLGKAPAEIALAAKSYLIVICPYPLRPSLQAGISERVVAHGAERKFLQTWVVPLRQKPFSVQ